jgi:multimeric flavodoxin WrbA
VEDTMNKAKTKHVTGFMGSPRKQGNTDILMDAVLEAAKEAGAATEKVILDDLTIGPCKACYACRTNGECIQKDDMVDLYRKMQKSEVWVIGTPVYWWGPSAQIKAFVDRWFAKAGSKEKKEKMFSKRRVVLVVPMGDTDPETGRHVVGMFKDALDYVGAELFDYILAPGAYDAGDVRSNEDLMQRARRIGRDSVTK